MQANVYFISINRLGFNREGIIQRQFTPFQLQSYKELFIIINKILAQQKGDKNKIYSIHESRELFNLKKMLNRIKEQIFFDLFQILKLWRIIFFRKLNLQNFGLFKV